MIRELWLTVSSADVRIKAFNFLKLIKPPDGTELTDQTIKLDWNKDTTDKWAVNDAKTAMLAAGFDWEKRDPTPPLSEDNFRVIYANTGTVTVPGLIPRDISVTAGDPVLHFELLEEWMGPALGPSDSYDLRAGVFPVSWPAGSTYEKWPVGGAGATLNAVEWVNVLGAPPISDSDYWYPTMVQKIQDTAANSTKVSSNGRGDSLWYRWTSVEDPDLGMGEEVKLFRESSAGEAFPIRSRAKWAI